MGFEQRAWRAFEGLARTLNARPARELARSVRNELKERVLRAGVRALDRVAGLVRKTKLKEPPILTAGSILERPFEKDPWIVTGVETVQPSDDDLAAATDAHLARLVRPLDATAPLPPLPDRFGIDRVVLLAGESEWAFAYWEIDPDRLAAICKSTPARAELRLVDDAGSLAGRSVVDPLHGRQHVRIPELGKRYFASLVSIDPESDGREISRSRWVAPDRIAAR